MRTHQQAMETIAALTTLMGGAVTHAEVIATYLRERGILQDEASWNAAPIPEDWIPPQASTDAEVIYWRQDAAARLHTALALARAAEKGGDLDRVAQITVGIILPTRAALANALSGDLYYPLCEGCSEPVQDGDVVFAVGDGEGQTGEIHADCERPKLDGHGGDGEALPDGAYLFASDPDYSPEGIARALADAIAYCGEDRA